MKKLLRFLKDYKKECFFAPIFKALEASFELLVPMVMVKIIDIGIANNNKRYIFYMAFVLILFSVTGLISAITAQYYSAYLGVGFGTKLRDELFDHILKFSHKEIDILGKDTLLTRLTNDTNQLQSGINLFFRQVLRSPFIVIGALIMSFIISKKMSIIFFVTIILLYFIVFFIMKFNIKLYKIVQLKLDKVLSITSNNLAGIRVIRAFMLQEDEKVEFDIANEELYKKQNLVSKFSSLMNPLTYFFINIAIIIILYKGSYSISLGELTTGEVIALVNYMSQILVELVKSANLFMTISKSLASAKRINEIFEIENSLHDGKLNYPLDVDNDMNILEFRNVSFKYPNSNNAAISNINFKIKKGETVGIIGGTGSGKSSIINLIPRFYDCTSGEILLAGKNIKEYKIEELRKNIALVEQISRLFEGSIKDNISWAKNNINDNEIFNAINLSLASEILNKNNGLDTYILAQGKNLSGGQKQRLSIARSLAKGSDILILDDSSSALDYLTDSKLRKNIKLLNTTTIIVSQRVISIKNADKIIVVDNGEIINIGTHDELLKFCEIYKEISSSQLA